MKPNPHRRDRLTGRAQAFAGALALAGALLVPQGCAHQRARASGEVLHESCEAFLRLVRWGDLRGAARYLAPERRGEFFALAGPQAQEEQLKVTDYEIEDARVEARHAVVLAKVSWYRLPSLSTHSERVVTEWDERDGGWWLTAIQGGPLPLPAATAR